MRLKNSLTKVPSEDEQAESLLWIAEFNNILNIHFILYSPTYVELNPFI